MFAHILLCSTLISFCIAQSEIISTTTPSSPTDPTAMCRERFNNSASVQGEQAEDGQCVVLCRNLSSSTPNSRNIPSPAIDTMAMPDGAKCGQNMECLNNRCYNSEDVKTCRQAVRNLTSLEYSLAYPCQVDCVGQGPPKNQNLANGSNCSLVSLLPPWVRSGTCTKGQCKVTDQNDNLLPQIFADLIPF